MLDSKQRLRSYWCWTSLFAAATSLLLLLSLEIIKIITRFQRSLSDLPEQTKLPQLCDFLSVPFLNSRRVHGYEMTARCLFPPLAFNPHEVRDYFPPCISSMPIQQLAQNRFSANI